MAYLLQVDFPMDGPFGNEMASAFNELAQSINEEEGFIWKIWTENPATKEAGGIYLFSTADSAHAYLAMHTKRLAGFGITGVNGKVFRVNSTLSAINSGPLTKANLQA